MMRKDRKRALLAVLAVGAMPWITTATCDPVTGAVDFFRDDDYYDDYYYEDVYFVDDYGCGYFFCF